MVRPSASSLLPLMRAGFVPDSISTDLHTASQNAAMKDMLNVMGKFLAMGREDFFDSCPHKLVCLFVLEIN